MNVYSLYFATALMVAVTLSFANVATAASHPYDFHADARMALDSFGPVDNAYGYMNLVTDEDGNGTINVMFSNASGINRARFNARVKFLNDSGLVVREEIFGSWIDSRGLDETVESKVSKPLTISDFDSIEVDFYLSDVSALPTR